MDMVERQQERTELLMFAPYCPVHEAKVLLFADNIDSIRSTDHGVELLFHCNCGYEGTWQADAAESLALSA